MKAIEDMPKIECPFVRKEIDGDYLITPEINPDYKWVFEDTKVWAEEKLHGTNVSILIQDGVIVSIWNRTERIPFFNHGKKHIVEGVLNSYERGWIDILTDGQHFGEVIGPKVNGNPYRLEEHLWIPFDTFTKKHLSYKSWGKYPKTFESIEQWMKTLMPLYSLMVHGKLAEQEPEKYGFVEGVVFKHPDGRLAKVRKDMFPWFKGERHGD
jgi:hypothetical protein